MDMPDPFFMNRAEAESKIQARLFVDLQMRIETLARQVSSALTVWQAAGEIRLGDSVLAEPEPGSELRYVASATAARA
jgi:hypothetical protein